MRSAPVRAMSAQQSRGPLCRRFSALCVSTLTRFARGTDYPIGTTRKGFVVGATEPSFGSTVTATAPTSPTLIGSE